MLNSAVYFLVEMAMRLALSIIPIRINKRPFESWEEYQRGAATQSQVEMWMRENPPAWAIVTGAVSRVIVLDFDGERGNATMRALGLDPHVRTGSGGHHVYFVHPGWHAPTVNSKSKRSLGERYPGLDIRADGGYAIFAGRSSSGEYVWLRDMTPDPLELLPDDVREALGLLTPPPPPPTQDAFGSNGGGSTQARSVWSAKILELALNRAPEHGRNNAGFWLACQLRDNGYSCDEAENVLSEFVARVPVVNTKGTPEPYTMEEATNSVRQAYARSPRQPWSGASSATQAPDKPRIQLSTIEVTNRELRHLATESFDAVRAGNDPPYLFVRSGQMVHVVVDEKGRYSIREASADYVRGCLTRSANFRRVWLDRGGERHEIATSPPLDAVRDILAQPSTSWGLPPLESITGVPLIRPDGSVITTPGYDPATWVIYTPAPGFSISAIPDRPSDEAVERAVCSIKEMYDGFPFVDHASRANMFALLLTPILRKAIRGCVPLALIDAPAAGTGKSLLAETVALIITGTNAVMQPAPTRDEEELRKLLTAVLSAGYSLSILDNVACRVESPNLARAVTASVWSDRILGQSRTIDLPQQTVWVITGNNITLGGDIPRRSYWIRLDAQDAQPWQRSGFKIPNLKEFILENRDELVGALLTIARSWYAAGQPKGDAPILGSFEEWSRIIGGILHHVKVLGFLENLQELYEQSDPSEGQWQGFLDHIYHRYSGGDFGVVDLVRLLRVDPQYHSILPDDLIDDGRDGNLFTKKVGNAFRQRVDRRYGEFGVHLVKAGLDRSTKTVRWRVEFQKEPPADYWPPAPPPHPTTPFAPPPGMPFSVTGL
jgi:hypothetical protein